MKASDIMTTEVVTIRGSATVSQAVKLMKEKGVRTLVVERRHDEDAYGILTESDIVYEVIAYGEDPQNIRVYEIMTKPCIVVNPDLAVEYVARLFSQTGIRFAPVIKDHLIGVISLSDILHNSNFLEQPTSVTLLDTLEKARLSARAICAEKGSTSPQCAAAWDVVEEIQAELSHQRAQKPEKTYFEEYCEEHPEAFESRIYDA